MTKLLAINGFKRSGKGTVADMVETTPGVGVVYQIGFADKLKRLAAYTLGLSDLSPQEQISVMDVFKLEDNGLYLEGNHDRLDGYVEGRKFLQELGTRGRELFGSDFWIDQVLPNPQRYHEEDKSDRLDELVDDMYPDFDVVAITDLRFENEAQRIKELGGIVWEVKRPGTASDGHASEQPLPRELVDRTIFNEQGLGELRQIVDRAAREDGLAC